MATKATQPAVSVSCEAQPSKPSAEPPAKMDAAEDLRRRRAGIACFL